jgi:hypothetical protein
MKNHRVPAPPPTGDNQFVRPRSIRRTMSFPFLCLRPVGPKVTFSQELHALTAHFADRPVCMSAILEATQGRGFHLLLVLISLPFLTPIPLPGLSTFFGLIVAVIGARLALGKKPWLPRRLLQRELPPRFLGRLLRATSWVLRKLEFLLRTRLVFMHDHFIFRRVAGALIALSGLFLLAPLPVPFSNLLPAWTVLLLAAGALERDGLFFIAGCVAFVATSAFFALLAFGGAQGVEKIRQLFAVA